MSKDTSGKNEWEKEWRSTLVGFLPVQLGNAVGMMGSSMVTSFGTGRSNAMSSALREYYTGSANLANGYPIILLSAGDCPLCKRRWLVKPGSWFAFLPCPACAPADDRLKGRILAVTNKDMKSYNQCPGCGKYAMLEIADEMTSFSIKCPKCSASFSLAVDGLIPLSKYPGGDGGAMLCTNCHDTFTAVIVKGQPVKCPRCGEKNMPS